MADHIQIVSQSQQFGRNRNASAMGTTHKGTAPSAGIYLEESNIFTGKYRREHFQILSREEMESLKNSRSKHRSANTKGDKGILILLKGKVSLNLRS